MCNRTGGGGFSGRRPRYARRRRSGRRDRGAEAARRAEHLVHDDRPVPRRVHEVRLCLVEDDVGPHPGLDELGAAVWDAIVRRDTAALNALRVYDWPGNLTQLENALRSMALLATRKISCGRTRGVWSIRRQM